MLQYNFVSHEDNFYCLKHFSPQRARSQGNYLQKFARNVWTFHWPILYACGLIPSLLRNTSCTKRWNRWSPLKNGFSETMSVGHDIVRKFVHITIKIAFEAEEVLESSICAKAVNLLSRSSFMSDVALSGSSLQKVSQQRSSIHAAQFSFQKKYKGTSVERSNGPYFSDILHVD